MATELNVGIIGVNTSGGWAAEAHVPAVQAVDGLHLTAVAAGSPAAADEAAQAFDVAKAYGDGLALIADPDIDVVTVATRVPGHRDLLLAALAAGKHVYSEWPLGAGSHQAREIADAARSARVKHAIGLQLRESPAVRMARDILRSGALGRALSASVSSTTAGFGPDVPPQFAYLEDPATFANMVTIQGAHTVDLLIALAGPLASMVALGSRQFPQIAVGAPRQLRERITFDHLLMQGRHATGAPFTLEVAGGRTGKTPFHLDLVGETGHLRLVGGAPRGLQSGRIGLIRDGEPQNINEGPFAALSDAAVNVAGVYAALRDDIRHDTSTVTDFEYAVRLTRLIEDVLTTPQASRLQADEAWPGR
ncbi:Gfo/Idh/MocA family oxidoreductase [Methylobacterium sp. J-059]|jgi:predicted dehydrogenase|uniref:Gfo/Idh/MocA family protein n=1 Tax=Methylobacterium sp. J-059 TaxID=2836643 RepID=UPI001FB91C80|nr:Gfo/Idh/MocA family oxidoreductase [Methylobacterium sp. J-059]MCJ2038984.1 Gfo/Idh/MocA family oxidoreductase [Methylobacterium sp. J-059]